MERSDLWLRKWQLTLNRRDGGGFVIASESPDRDFRCTFQTQAADFVTPATAIITIYNMSDGTMKGLIKEFDQVRLSAGYRDGRYGEIFAGQVKQYARGHEENMTESYLRIYAADHDPAHRYAVSNNTLHANATAEERYKAVQDSFGLKGVPQGYQATPASEFRNYRGSVLFGLGADEIREELTNSTMAWNIIDGKMTLTRRTGYQPGDIAELNAQTGLIGHPEITDNGLSVTSLLNPDFRVKGRVKLNNDSINWVGAPGGGNALSYWPFANVATVYESLSADGIYIILVRTHEGDTRGTPWYTHLTCIAHDPSAAAALGGIDPRRAAKVF